MNANRRLKKLMFLFVGLLGLGVCCGLIGDFGVVVNAGVGGMVINYDFETGVASDWYPRGDGVKIRTVKGVAHSGDYSLLTTGRSKPWNGPSVNIQGKVDEGAKYVISAWVKIASDRQQEELIMTIEKNKGNDTSWDRVAGPVKVNKGEWVKLTGEYLIPEGYERLTLYIESPGETVEYYIDDVTVVEIEPETKKIEEEIPSLSKMYEGFFTVGAAIEPYQLKGEHERLLIKHFNSLTAENVMKPQSLQPQEGVFNFEPADKIVDFAMEHGMQVRGHTLLWHNQVPEWMFVDDGGKPASRELLLQRLKKHIQTVVGRYKGRVYAWDVVNEVIDPGSSETDGLRKSKWLRIIGEDYIAKAFEYAHEADPQAKLFINDYNTYQPAKRELIYNLVKKLKEQGVPVHGVGMQMHVNINYPSIVVIEEAIKKFASLGVEIHITELDMSVYEDDSQSYEKAPEKLLIKQGYRYKDLFELFKEYSKSITSVTFWGMADDHTWLTNFPVQRNNWPLLFDQRLKAKYAFWGLVDPAKLPPYVESATEKTPAKTTYAVKGAPQIDGIMDEIWEKANIIKTGVWVLNNTGATAKVRTMWDENHLYIFAEVTDKVLSKASANTWEQDSVEIFIDENNHKTTYYEADDSQYRVNYDNEQSFDPNPVREGFVTATRMTDQGYVVEAAIEFITIKAEAGQKIGFDFQVNDDQGAGKRASIVKWNDPTDNSYKDTSGIGVLVFAE